MSENEQIAFLQTLREKLEIELDMMRDDQWRKWQEWDTMIAREIRKIETQREQMTESIIGGK